MERHPYADQVNGLQLDGGGQHVAQFNNHSIASRGIETEVYRLSGHGFVF